MKKIYMLLIALFLLIPSAVYASTLTESTEQEAQALLMDYTEDFTAYLKANINDEAIYDDNVRMEIVKAFTEQYPQYNDLREKLHISNDHIAKDIKQDDIYKNVIQVSDTTTQTYEMYVKYYDDGSCMFGIFSATDIKG